MANNTENTENQGDDKPKRVVNRKPLYVLVPTGYVDKIVGEGDDAVMARAPEGYKLLGQVMTKKEVGKLLSDEGFDPTNGIENVLVIRGQVLPIKLSTQVVVKF